MFNMLNRWISKGKKSPMVCKFLDSVSTFLDGIRRQYGSVSYLIERVDLKKHALSPVGLRIAFPIWGPAFIRIRSGKD
jgi:hypothetical protein